MFSIRTKTGRSGHQMVVDEIDKAGECDGTVRLLESPQRKERPLIIHMFLKSMSEKTIFTTQTI